MKTLREVKDFWHTHINNEYYTGLERASKSYYEEIERKRYRYHYHLRDLFAKLGTTRKGKLLEIGCGIGIDTVMLSKLGFRTTAVDLTSSALGVAQKRNRAYQLGIQYGQSNAEELPFPQGCFDLVYSFGVIHHTPRMDKAVQEIHRVLKTGGKAHVMVYSRFSLVNAIHRLLGLPYESPRNLQDHCPVVICSSKRSARKLFAGFSEVSIHSDYPFTYGMRFFSRFFPTALQRMFGRWIGWHLMIEATK